MKVPPDNAIVGIDYGKKMNGTTVLCTIKEEKFTFQASPVNKDADQFLLNSLQEINPEIIFIDAPLSLPGIYSLGDNFNDYFFREADQAVSAMSPMFLGGLTARGIRMKDQLVKAGFSCCEVYPARLAYELGLREHGYKDNKANIDKVLQKLKLYLPLDLAEESLRSWHYVDALLATISGIRYKNNQHLKFGNEQEGLIIA